MTKFDYGIIALYLLSITVIGIVCTKKQKTTTSFLLGGGSIPWWAAAISYMMALISTVSLVATPGESYNNGLRLYVMDFFAPIPALIFFHIFMRFYFTTKVFTPFTYLENRFDSKIRLIVSVIYFFTRITYLALVLFSCSMVFKGMANFDPPVMIIALSLFSIFYCMLGGLKAVIWTNVLQFAILVGGLIAVLLTCIKNIDGGVLGVIDYAFANGRGFNLNAVGSSFFSFDPHVRVTLWLLMFSSSTTYLSYNTSDQISIQQLLGTKSYQQARKSYITSIITFIPFGGLLWFLGLSVFSYFGQNPLPEGNPPGDTALFKFISIKMPSPMPGLVAAAMLAAAISTIGACLTSFSTIATKDFYFRFFKPSATEEQQVRFSRIMVLVIGIFATLLGMGIYCSSSALKETVLESSAIWIAISAVVAPTFLIGVLNKRCNAVHALSAIIIGMVITIGMASWYVISKRTGNPVSFLYIQVPGILTMIVYGFIAPLLFGQKPDEKKLKNLTWWTFDKKTLEKSEHLTD